MPGSRRHHLEALDPDPLCVARCSRWMRKVHRCPRSGADPLGYLEVVRRVVGERPIDVVLPTHEQAWLFAAAKPELSDVPVAVADVASFVRVQSKVEFARLLDEIGLAQPRWRLVRGNSDLDGLSFPYWLKSAFSTAGRGVRLVADERSRTDAVRELLEQASEPLMAQEPAVGQYGQVQALFDHGRLVAAHTSVQTGIGIGPSAAARISVDHQRPRRDIARLGQALRWHGGLTLDYLHEQGEASYIECNPRTVEPGNATASGLNIPDLQVRLTIGEQLTSLPRTGRAGVRTHGTIALVLGAAAYDGTRRAVAAQLAQALAHRGCYHGGAEQLTPVLRDPPSAAVLVYVTAQTLASPRQATAIARKAIDRYTITQETIHTLAASSGASPTR